VLHAVTYPGLSALPDAYARVFEDGSRQSFFLTLDWFRNFFATVVQEPQHEYIVGVETDDGRPVAVMPMMWAPGRNGVLSPVSLSGASNYYTCCFAPALSDAQDTSAAARALAAGLWSHRRQWDVVTLQPLDRGAAIYADLARALRDVGMVTQTYFCFGNWYLEVAGRSYLEYLESLSSVMRKNVPYNIRRLEKSGRSHIEIVTREAELESALDAYEKVYNSSWKIPEPYPHFIRGLARLAARNGWLRMGLIHIDGEPAAAQIWIVHGGVASIYKIAYDERYAKLSTGTVLTSKLMQHVIDVDKVRIVDYLSGDDDYKKMWMSHRREFWGIVGFNPRSLRGAAQIVRHVGGRFGKQLLERTKRRWARASARADGEAISRD
jgi:CelD/BcsL family acetyltransferase involved in cellulose biosynthesis